MNCSLCASPLEGSSSCRVCGTPVGGASSPSAGPPALGQPSSAVAGAEARIASLSAASAPAVARALAGADAAVARALEGGTRPATPGSALRRLADPVALIAEATLSLRGLGALPSELGLPSLRRRPLSLQAGPGLVLEVDGPRRGDGGPLQLHYASLHRGEPFPHRLVLGNKSASPIDDVIVQLQVPRYSASWSRTTGRLERGEPLVLDDVRLDVDVDRMRTLVEADTSAQLDVRVHVGGSLRHAETLPLEVLAYREWRYDLTDHPEALACFVQPNDPALQPVLAATASLLEEVTGDGSLCGYQKPAEAHWPLLMTLALHEALQSSGVRYINPPASFEFGQKIRLPGDVLTGRMGTCLDLAVLWCSLLEAIGLHPLLVVIQGHAFQGVWLDELVLAEPWTDALQPVVDSFSEGRLLLFNSTTFTDSGSSMDDAVSQAIAYLGRVPFRCMVDVKAAREVGVRPLP